MSKKRTVDDVCAEREALKEDRPRLIAEIDALRSELEAMRRERDEYAAAASDLMRYYDNCFDQRLQAVPANIAIIDPIKFILGQKPCYFGRRPDDRDRLAAEWDELRAAARSVRNGE